jgi:SAM-dependent methyltransferase
MPSRTKAHFARLYDANDDPWGFRSSRYERAKYERTVRLLGRRHFRSGLEVGCSIGVLSRMLTFRCRSFTGIDILEAPLRSARRLCADRPGATFRCMNAPRNWPQGRFDLIILSEVLYFLSPADIALSAVRVRRCLLPNGLVVLVNWCGRSTDPVTGEAAATLFTKKSIPALPHLKTERGSGYRLDLLGSGRSA